MLKGRRLRRRIEKMIASPRSIQVGSNAVILEVLNRNNYEKWRLRVKTYLLSEDIWDVVNTILEPSKLENDQAGFKDWTKKNARALYAIQSSCGPEMFPFISETESAKTAWEALEQEFKVLQGYDENNDDHSERYTSFIASVRSGDWEKAKKCLGEVDVRGVLLVKTKDGDFPVIALHDAAKRGHGHIVKEMVHLMTQEDLKTKTWPGGDTALHLAAAEGHVHVVKELPVPLMGGVKDRGGNTALHIAVQERKVAVVKELMLLMRQEDLKLKNEAGYTALHLAVHMADMPVVKELILTDRKGLLGCAPPLIGKLFGDCNQTIEYLRKLENYCGVITAVCPQSIYGNTGLHIAIKVQHLDAIKEMISLLKTREENLQLKTAEDFTSFGNRITLGVSDELLMKHAKYMIEQYERTVRSCLEIQNDEGFTALFTAADRVLLGFNTKEHLDIFKELVPFMRKEGLEIKEAGGYTALHRAIIRENVNIVKELIPWMRQEGLEIQDVNGNTPLNTAVLKGDVDIVKVLVQSMRLEGLTIKNKNGSNALHLAAMEEHLQIVKELLPLMTQYLEEKDGHGYTAISWVIQCFKDEDVCEIAKIMALGNNTVFGVPSAPKNDIPVVDALRWNKWESVRYIYSVTPLEVLQGPNGIAFICYCLNARKNMDLALNLLPRLRLSLLSDDMSGGGMTRILLELSRMNDAYLSGRQLTRWQRWIYKSIHIRYAQEHQQDTIINVRYAQEHQVEDDHNDKKNFCFSVLNLFRRFAKGLHELSGMHDMYEVKASHNLIFQILRYIAKTTTAYSLTPDELKMVKTSIFSAIQKGNSEFVTHILKGNPALLGLLSRQVGEGIFHLAIENRQKEVFSLMYGLKERERHAIGLSKVNEDNNLLHYAANLSSLPQFDHILDASLQMQRELQWFKEVERVVPGEMREYRNRSNDMTARELFTKNHKSLMEDAVSSIKGTATSCTVVGALIVTMMFAAAFTFPGGNHGNTGLPLLIDHKLFNVFVVFDLISLVSSTSSVITFLGILTSRYAEDDFLKSLPTKMIIGLTTLFFSIVSMMIVFSCALILMYEGKRWIIALSIVFASVPVTLFLWLLFPFLIKTFMSTYGHDILDNRKGRRVLN